MSTNSTLGYIDPEGNFRGTYIHSNGVDVGRAAQEAFATAGYFALLEWILIGIEGGGYSGFRLDKGPRSAERYLITLSDYFSDNSLEFAWVATADGVLPLENYLHNQKAGQVAYHQCWEEVELAAEGQEFHRLKPTLKKVWAVDRLASSRYGAGSAVHEYVSERLGSVMAELAK